MMTRAPLEAPFPWFGGKRRVADVVWQRFGRPSNYVEPFFGSGAVLLGRPDPPKTETVNDRDGFVANFWRSVQADPEKVAEYADCPVNECDLHARHVWLRREGADLDRRLEADPDYHDAKIAGWWVWGISIWIGRGWCGPSGAGPWSVQDGKLARDAGMGVVRQLPHLGNAGMGVVGDRPLVPWMLALAERLRNVRVCCGDWTRVLGASVTFKHGETAVFLDPPYDQTIRKEDCYAHDSHGIAKSVREWCLENGQSPLLRIALCGYEGEHNTLTEHGWTTFEWTTQGGYAMQGNGRGRDNKNLERIWFSPSCIYGQRNLF